MPDTPDLLTNPPTRDEILGLLTDLHEDVVTPALFGGRAVLIRELTARQRMEANAAATAADPDTPDNALYQAMLIQMSVVDPRSGTPYADGRRDANGEALIDPRTRAPLLTVGDVQAIADGRDLAVTDLVNRIVRLSALGPRAMFRGDLAPDGGERNAGAGAQPAHDAAPGDAAHRPDDDDGRPVLAAQPAGRRDEPGPLEPGDDAAPGA